MNQDETLAKGTDFSELTNHTELIELSSEASRYRSMIDQTTDAMYLCDLNGQIVDVNLQACKIMEYTREELLMMKVSDLDATHDTYDKTAAFFKSLQPEKNSLFESNHRKKSGTVFPVEINTCIINLNGTPHIIGFARDITNRKVIAEALRESEELFRILFEQASDGIIISDKSGRFLNINSVGSAMLGYSKEEISNYSIPDILTETDKMNLGNALKKANTEQIIKKGMAFIRKDQSVFYADIVVKKLPDKKLQATLHDVTDLKQNEAEIRKLNEELERKIKTRTRELENRSNELSDNQKALLNLVEDLNEKSTELTTRTEQLQLANKELEAFSYSVSHDLRAPLRAINGFVSILLEDYYSELNDEGKRICTIIQSNALKMGQLIDDLLSFSRLVRSDIKYSEIEMEKLANLVIADIQSHYPNLAIKFELKAIPKATGDTNMIRQVWINLISNAVKYSSLKEQIKIQIDATQNENELIYFIKDNGVGFDMKYSNKLFGVFQRLHNKKEFEGTGVGLAIVQRIIHRHNGRVWANSKIGQGATFYFSLPKQNDNLASF